MYNEPNDENFSELAMVHLLMDGRDQKYGHFDCLKYRKDPNTPQSCLRYHIDLYRYCLDITARRDACLRLKLRKPSELLLVCSYCKK